MTPDAKAPATGPLTIDQAASILHLLPKKEPERQQPEPAAPETEIQASEPTEADDAAALEPSDVETVETGEGQEGDDPELAPIPPPQFWDAESKRRFGELPRDIQEVVLKNEQTRNTATSRAIEEASVRRKAAEQAEQRLTQYTQALDQILPQAAQTFRNRWENVDWNAVVDQYGADEALKLQNTYQEESRQVQQLAAARADAEDYHFAQFVQAESARLPELAPDLADPKEGPKRRKELGEFLVAAGVNPHVLRDISAIETSLAYDAMRWRKAQANAKNLSQQPKSAAPQQRLPLRPTASPSQRSTNSQRVNELSKKSRLSIDEAAELHRLRG